MASQRSAGPFPDDLLTHFLQNLNAADDGRFIPAEKHAAQHLGQAESGARHLMAAGLISQLSDHFTINHGALAPSGCPKESNSPLGLTGNFPFMTTLYAGS